MRRFTYVSIFLLFLVSCAEGEKTQSNNVNNANNVNNTNNVNNVNNTNNTNCSNECVLGGSQCDIGLIQSCVTGTSGCTIWQNGTDCALSGQICQLTGNVAACADTCTDACTLSQTSCNGDQLQTCNVGSNGCTEWQETEDCTLSGRLCSDQGGGSALCACDDQCSASDDDVCQGTVPQSCEADAYGCYDWVSGTDCATGSQVCTVTGGVAACTDPSGPTVLLSEGFDTWVPAGWTVTDYLNDGYTWEQCNGCSFSFLTFTLANGPSAFVDSDAAGTGSTLDEYLTSPVFSCSGYATVTLEFDFSYNWIDDDFAAVEVSDDGGSTWTEVANYAEDLTDQHANIDISSVVAGSSSVQIRCRDYAAYDWYGQFDTVVVTGN